MSNETKLSPAAEILSKALNQVDDVLTKADQTLKLLQENIQQVQLQRVACNAQKQMLVELINKIIELDKQPTQ